ncbi:MAG: hypothetical protein OHK0029_14850 [Armatimonadaceae bacterium]
MAKKPTKKPNLSPEAQRILEQYRNATKPTGDAANAGDAEGGSSSGPKPNAAPPNPAMRQRSGTRGK